MTRRAQLAEAVRHLDCADVAGEQRVAAARAVLAQYAPETRAITPLRRAEELLADYRADREVCATLLLISDLLPAAPAAQGDHQL